MFVLGENHFRKCGCLVGPENRIFQKSISVDRKKYALTMEMNFRSYFHFKWIPDRERERERESERKKRRTPSSSPVRRSHALDIPVLPIAAPHRSHRAARSHELQSDDHTTPIAPSISPPRDLAFDPPISLSMWFWFLCDFDFYCCCGGVVVVFWWLWLLIAGVCCRGLNCRMKNL